MIDERDVDRVNETTAERAERLAKERYTQGRAAVHSSSGWQKWKSLTSAQRTYIAVALVAVVIVAVMLIINYWDVPQAPSPRGEGG